MNSVTIMGRLGSDPETRFFDGGSSLTEVSIAIDKGKDKEGGKRPPAWIRVKAWNKPGILLQDYCKKGELVGVTGELDEDSWEDRETGKRRSVVYVRASRVHLMPKAKELGAAPPSRLPAPSSNYDDIHF